MGKKDRIKREKQSETQEYSQVKTGTPIWQWLAGLLLGMLVVSNLFTYMLAKEAGKDEASAAENYNPLRDPNVKVDTISGESAAPDPTLDMTYKIVNAHDHLYREQDLPKYLQAAARTGIARTLFVASSEFTFVGTSGDPQKLNDWSTREILKCAEKYPGQIIPFATLHPNQQDKIPLLQEYISLGIQGLKLYSGHGNFYDRPLNDPSMIEVYAWCEENGLPICWHVNFLKYGQEFEEVVALHPNLKIIVPHFGLGFYDINGEAMARMLRLMDTYPGMYADISFGTREILVAGLEEINTHHEKFRELFIKYQDRILWGTDMVVTGNKEKTVDWVESVIRACRDMMEKDTYYTWMAAKGSPYAEDGADHPYGQLRGMNLPPEVLHKIYETNIDKILFNPALDK